MEHQDLIITGLCKLAKYLAFDSATNSVAGRFPIICSKKCPCYIIVENWLVVAKVQKSLIVLALPSTAATKIVNTFDLGQILLDGKQDYSLQLMSETGVMIQIIRNDAQWDVMKYTIFLEIYHHKMHGILALVPVTSLDFVLHDIVIIISRVQENDTLCLLFLVSSVWDVMKYTILLEIYHHRMHDTLPLVPVTSLDFVLHDIVINFSKV